MKKIIAILCLFGMISPCVAEEYLYKNQAINGITSDVKRDGCAEYVTLPEKQKFNFTRNFLGLTTASAIVIPALLLDPYVVKIDKVNYVMVKDRTDNDWSEKDLVGIDDPKENRFESLIALNSDGDYSKLTSAELKKAGVRFVQMTSDGTLLVKDRKKDYDLNKIDYIDIINLKRTANSESTGIFGHFTVYLKTQNPKKRAVVGFVTYETDKKIQILFK